MNTARVVATLWIALAMPARAQDSVVIVGASKITLMSQRGPRAARTDSITVPVRFRPKDGHPVPFLRIRSVQLNGHSLPTGAVRMSIDSSGDARMPRQPLSIIVAYDRATFDSAGEYVIVGETYWPAASMTYASQSVTLTLTRLPAELGAATPRRIVYTRWAVGESSVKPESLLLEEKGGRTALVPSDSERRADLVDDAHMPTGAQVRLTFPKDIPPRGQASALVHIDGWSPLGKSSATVTLPSASLSTGAVDIPIEVITRPPLWFLPIVIILGIWSGRWLRTKLEDRRQRKLAVVVALKRVDELVRAINATWDPVFHKRLERVRNTLLAVVNDDSAKPASITDAAAKAATEQVASETELAALIASTQVALGQWESALVKPNDLPTEIAKVVPSLQGDIERRQSDVRNGVVTEPKAFVDAARAGLVAPLASAADAWKLSVDANVRRIGKWPDIVLAEAMATLGSDAKSIADGLGAATSADAVREQLRDARRVAGMLKRLVAAQGLASLVKYATTLADDIAQLKSRGGVDETKVERSAVLLKRKVRDVQLVMEAEGKSPDIPAAFDKIGVAVEALRSAMNDSFATVSATLPNDLRNGINVKLGAGQYLAALDDVRNNLPEDPSRSVEADEALVALHSFSNREKVKTRESLNVLTFDDSRLSVTLDIPDTITVDLPASLAISVRSDRSTTPPRLSKVTWLVNGVEVVANGENRMTFRFGPVEPGLYDIAVSVRDDAGDTASAMRTVTVLRSSREEAVAQAASANRDEIIQTIGFGALIVVGGVLVFGAIPLEMPQAFVVPFFWGFMTDVGVARLREITAPISAQVLSVP